MTRPARPRVVVAGLGDTGLLTALHLARHVDVVGVSATESLVSGQELGLRLTRPRDWTRDYWVGYERYHRLAGARVVHGLVTGLDAAARTVRVSTADGATVPEPYDALVVATGVANGFWRPTGLRTDVAVARELEHAHRRLADARSIVVVGGGAAAVSVAANAALRWPGSRVTLCFPGERPLLQHHPRVWRHLGRRLRDRGVVLRPGHRAVLPRDEGTDAITSGPVRWSTGQDPTPADAVLWAVGRVRPHTGWLPAHLLDDDGFVRVTSELRLPDHPEIFAVGDVAASDPLRSSARNRADRLVARNVRAHLAGRPLGAYRAPRRRWGSVIGPQPDGLEVFAPRGRPFRFPAATLEPLLGAVVVRRGIYGGVRRPGSLP